MKNKIEVDEMEFVLPIPNNGNMDASDTINDNGGVTYIIIRLNLGVRRKSISDLSGKSIAVIGGHIALLKKMGLIEH